MLLFQTHHIVYVGRWNMGGVKTRTFIYDMRCVGTFCRSITYRDVLSAYLLTRAVCREQDGVLRHVGRQGGQRAGVQTWSGTRVRHVTFVTTQ